MLQTLLHHVLFLLGRLDVEDVVAPHQHLAKISCAKLRHKNCQLKIMVPTCLSSVNELLGVCELEVHVAVCGNQEPFVLMAPLQLHHHRLPGQTVQEGLGVDWHSIGHPD